MNGTGIELGFDCLLREIERYLAAVEAFRAEGCEPRWRREGRFFAGRGTMQRIVTPAS